MNSNGAHSSNQFFVFVCLLIHSFISYSRLFDLPQRPNDDVQQCPCPCAIFCFGLVWFVSVYFVLITIYIQHSCTTMFFYRNKHIMVDLGTGNNNKINWALADKQEMIDIIEMVYRGARKGRGLVVSPKDYSTKYQY